MDLWNELAIYFSDAGSTRRLVLLGSVLLGISSGILGSFAVLRRQSLLGDAMAHAALPGVCLAFLLTGYKDPLVFLVGASLTGILGAWAIFFINNKSRLKEDTAIGLVLSVFFGIGIVLLSIIQSKGMANQSGLDRFLFGKVAALLPQDVYVMSGLCILLSIVVYVFYKEFKILAFDPNFGAIAGFPIKFLDYLLTGLIVLVVMIGLQAVGVVLMVAMLILPAAAARQWTDRLGNMLVIAATIGAVCAASGSILSTLYPRTPTGPVMVVTNSLIFFASLLLAPRRGLLPVFYRRYRQRRNIKNEHTLKALYQLCEEKKAWKQLWSIEQIAGQLRIDSKTAKSRLKKLRKAVLVTKEQQQWRLTTKGLQRAQQIIRKHRLWELYLIEHMDIALDHVHRDADEIEHLLPAELTKQLAEILPCPPKDPHN